MLKFALVLLLVVMIQAPAYAQLHKCTGKDGRTTYSDTPCQASESAQTLAVPRGDPPPPRATAPGASGGAGRPALSPAAQAHEERRKKLIAESRASDQRIEEAGARVRQIKAANYDPRKCAAVQSQMQRKTTRDSVGSTYDPDMMELRGMRELYCGP